VSEISTEPTAEQVMLDQSSSEWLKTALRAALERDPVDALSDALLLAELLEDRLREALQLLEYS